MILKFEIHNQKLIRKDEVYLVNLSQEYLKCEFRFSSEWESLTRYVTFSVKGRHYRFEITGSQVKVPNDVLKYKYFYIRVHGTDSNGEQVITTDELIILLKISGHNNELSPSGDVEVTDVLTLVKAKLKEKIDHLVLNEHNLVCYSEGEIVEIIPFDFLQNYYDKSEVNDLLNETIIDVSTDELASDGLLIFRRHNL